MRFCRVPYSLLCTELRVRVVALVTGEAQVLNPSPSDRSPRFLTVEVLNARPELYKADSQTLCVVRTLLLVHDGGAWVTFLFD